MKKNQVILLNDIPTKHTQISLSRPIGCYVIASALEKQGYDCLVIDWFTKINNFHDYLKNFIKFGDLEKVPGTLASERSEP